VRRFRGSASELFFVSDPAPFTAALGDCGDGFDWRVSDQAFSAWCSDPAPTFEAHGAGGWEPVEPSEVHPQSGRVSFDRCLAGMGVYVRGFFYPTSRAGVSGAYGLSVSAATERSNSLGDGSTSVMTMTKVGEATASLEDVELDAHVTLGNERMLVRMPQGPGDIFGVGEIVSIIDRNVRIRFDEGSLAYVPR